MSSQTYFRQNCPACSRALRFSIELLGRDAKCHHCGSRFVARDANIRDEAVAHDGSHDGASLEHPLLLVQFNRDQLAMLTRRFTELGYHVTPVFHPRQALEASTFKGFRVAVVDGSLPEMAGVELARRLMRRVSDLLVILLVDLEQESAEHGETDGIWQVLRKPVSIAQLESSIEEAIQESKIQSYQRLLNSEESRWLMPYGSEL